MSDVYEAYEEFQNYENGLELEHYGTPRHSGRYPWGSGENPYQHGSADWLARVEQLKKRGLSEKQQARAMNCTVTQLRAWKSNAKDERRAEQVKQAKELAAQGLGASEIARRMGLKGESTARSYLNEASELRMNQAKATAKFLEEQIDKKGFIDIGKGVELGLGDSGISREKLKQAVELMKDDGYNVYTIGIEQVTNPGQQTNTPIACGPDAKYKDAYTAKNEGKIQTVLEYDTKDGGLTWNAPKPPVSIDSKRIQVRYNEEGGIDKDGVIELRRGVPDLSLGNSHYAQVRIAVDGTHYLKGMAVYADDLPPGIDIRFNTNKHKGTPMISSDRNNEVLKRMKNDPGNPFGATIMAGGQATYTGEDGKKHQSAINKIHDEGDWMNYNKELPAQFLSKQPLDLIKKQIDITYANKEAEFKEIMSLTNPTIKKHYLDSFASDCDAASIHLKVAALPRQKYQVILPVDSLKDNEVYAPNYKDGEQVALVRFPHGGTFEIPILTVNNHNAEAMKSITPKAMDAVGINKKNADRLSGADFDGDDVLVIPCGRGSKVKINSTEPLKDMVGYDAKEEYASIVKTDPKTGDDIYFNAKTGKKFRPLEEEAKQIQMGITTNLITDMTLRGAPVEDIVKVVKHSQTVIDATKHKLDWKQSEKDNDIARLKKDYQIHVDKEGNLKAGGAATLFSRAKNPEWVRKTKGEPWINQKGKPWYDDNLPEGALIPKYNDKDSIYYVDGEKRIRKKKSNQMAETRDAFKLSSGTPEEDIYAQYANNLKDLANKARKEMVYTENLRHSPSAKKTYAAEVASLNTKLKNAQSYAPREREANVIAIGISNAKISADPTLSKKEIKKIKQNAIEIGRSRMGIDRKDREIDITDREWEAIQAGAISEHTLNEILNNTNADKLRERATPKSQIIFNEAKISKMKAMYNGPYTIKEIAESLGVSPSTVSKYLKGKDKE